MATPRPGSNQRTGGRILIDQLALHRVRTVFCVPGESYLSALDALYDVPDIRVITCRHEAGAGFMAEAWGKLTGTPGVALVTRGPGACNAAIAVHTAFQDSSPMLLLVGQVERRARGREAFQEVDLGALFGWTAKWVGEAGDPARLPELVSRAFYTACAGRPGPVVLGLPEDMLVEACAAADADPYRVVRPHPGAADVAALRAALEQASRPLVIVGGGGWSAEAAADITAFAEANALPVACSFRTQDIVDNTRSVYCGDLAYAVDPALGRRVREADLLIVIGARLGEVTTQGYTLVEPPRSRQRLVHVYADTVELGRVFQPDVAICSGMAEFAAVARALAPVAAPRWQAWAAAARA
ncbi:MAG: thiamine pyrophosphate-binding protein, partial [Alphaproteobacteria bacterium]|nr:thiamine pyrophosphate-binding protein [Alphaproteobacteria bacterium]